MANAFNLSSSTPAAPAGNQNVSFQADASAIPNISAYVPVLSFTAPLAESSNTVSMPAATASVDGYLAHGDWATFNAKPNLAGDFGGTSAAPKVAGLQGVPISSTAPSDGQVLMYVAADSKWEPKPASGLTFTAPLTNTSGTIAIAQASASVDGYLSHADWATFNSKQAALTLGNFTEATSAVLTITGGIGAVIGSGLSVQVKQASASQNGYLSSTDWTTFNSKQAALTLPLAITQGGTGSASAGAALTALGGASLASANAFTGNQTFSGSVALNGATTFGAACYSTPNSPEYFNTSNVTWQEFGLITVKGAAAANDQLVVQYNSRSTLGGSDSWSSVFTIAAQTGALALNTATALNGAVTLNAGLNLNGQTITGNATISGSLTFNSGNPWLIAPASLDLRTGNATWAEWVLQPTQGGSLSADAWSFIYNSRSSSGGSDVFSPAFTIAAVTGAITLSTPTALNGAVTLGAGLNLNGQTISGNASFTGATNFPAISLTGTMNLNGQTISGNAAFSGNLTYNGTSTFGALGTATSSANYNSQSQMFRSSYWTGSAAANDIWTISAQPATGANPFSQLVITHSSGSPNLVNPVSIQHPAQAALDLWNTTTGGTPSAGAHWRLFADNVGGGGGALTFGLWDNANLRLPFGVDNGGITRAFGLQVVGGGLTWAGSGAGVEIGYDPNAAGYVQTYNRSNSTWLNMQINAAQIAFGTSGATALTITSAGKLSHSMWNLQQPMSNTAGPLPLSASFTTHGGTVLLIVSGSGYTLTAATIIGANIVVDGTSRGTLKVYANAASTHLPFVPVELVLTGLTSGSHTLSLTAISGTSSDANDTFSVAVIEFPF
jgi:hypothetical protein